MKTSLRILLTVIALPFIGAGLIARFFLQAAYFGWTTAEVLLGELFSG